MKKTIKYLIPILLVIMIILIIIISKNSKKNEESYAYSEFKNYKEEYVPQKKKYDCNEFSIIDMDTEGVLQIYFNNFKTAVLEDAEVAFNMLDKEYREKRFGNLESFKEYITSNYNLIRGASLSSYIANEYGNYTQYVCVDSNGNYCIFRETAIMEYTILLDTYTIELPEFTEKYYNATEQQKVALNIDRFIQAINNKDYAYSYNCLADSYKNNYFKTQKDFETYVKQNFYEKNIVGYKQFDTQGELYTYSVILTNPKTGEQLDKTFIMQLGENTDFVLSFNK